MQSETVLSKAHDIWKLLFPILAKCPRHYKFTLGDRSQQHASDLMELLVEAYYSSPEIKKPLLHKANIKVELLRRYLRIAYELGVFSSSTLARLSEPLDEIGRMIGGWIKSLR